MTALAVACFGLPALVLGPVAAVALAAPAYAVALLGLRSHGLGPACEHLGSLR